MALFLRSSVVSTFGLIGLAASALPAYADGNAAHGKKLFTQSCSLCHATGHDNHPPAGQGPLLAGVLGRAAGSLPGFGYTAALKASGLTWDAAALDKFLAAPTSVVPGTLMVVAVPDAGDRADLVAFLSTLKPVKVEAELARGHPKTPGDYQNDAPGAHHRFDLAQLPEPYATKSAGNSPSVVAQPEGAHLSVPDGFQVKLFAPKTTARIVRVAPNGDIFLAETGSDDVRVLRAADGAEAPSEDHIFAKHLDRPFGLAWYPLGPNPEWLYVAENNRVVRYAYKNGDLEATGKPEVIIPKLANTTGGHTSRDLAFSPDGKTLFISIGSSGNIADGISTKTPDEIKAWEAQPDHGWGSAWEFEEHRASVMACNPDGSNFHAWATGIRNAVGLAIQPSTGLLWVSTNERDGLGDDLVPDYISHIEEGHFYGWPWYYMGNHEDPRRKGERPDLAGKATVPDLPVQPHSASLEMTFYPDHPTGVSAFPAGYSGDIFAAFHGSWNRTGRTGSKVIRVHLVDGKPTGEYEDFLVGWVVNDATVWGRPVGVAVAHDGALLVTEDAGQTLWRVSTVKK